MTLPHGEFLVFVDESGDHGLEKIDPAYPVFVLAFCIVRKDHYARHLLPALTEFKFRHFGHDQVVLHVREIRKDLGPFEILREPTRKAASGNFAGLQLRFEPKFVPKQANVPGLQIADLVARPIGRVVLDPAQNNRAYEVIERKLDRSPSGAIQGWGLKVFP